MVALSKQNKYTLVSLNTIAYEMKKLQLLEYIGLVNKTFL